MKTAPSPGRMPARLPERLSTLKAAVEHLHAARFARAADLAQRLLAEQPGDVEALLVLGLALGGEGETERAALLLTGVGRARPANAHPCGDLADLLRRHDRIAEARAQFRAAREIEPADPRLAHAYAEFLLETGHAEEALGQIEEALRLKPDFPPALDLLAIALAERGRLDEALARFRRIVAADPLNPAARANLALALAGAGRFDAALAAYNEALLHAPEDAYLHVQRAMALLKSGRLLEGWSEYEWRVRQPGRLPPLPPARLLPALADIGAIGGKTVLLTHDEGLGDTLQFLRYATLLAREGARVLAAVPRELARLVGGMPAIAEVLSGGGALPQFDFHCPFIGLPRVFATTLPTIPAEIPYLRADPSLVAEWARRLPPVLGCRVGLVWSGAPRPGNRIANLIDRRRSMPLAALAPLACVPDVHFVALQKGVRAAEAQNPPPGMRLDDPMDAVEDFADTAAIIANLDLVVSVDTSVAHLAGALGKPVFLLDRFDNCWRWLTARTDSPWYPALRIFRQARPGEWSGPVAEAAAALREHASRLAA